MKKFLSLSILVIISTLLLAGCGGGSSGEVAKDGDTVSVHYTGTLEDGTVFDSSVGKIPLTFTLGGGQMIKGFDDAVRGMKVGETRTVTLPPEEAYGEWREDLIVMLDRAQFPIGMELTIGQQVPMQNSAGMQFTVTIIEIGTTTVTVDANHELAGKSLIFEIELVSITPGGG
ncbi:MAG: FKBP-type peptidyl-prolyl cis-trans isomerase [Dehalococcoidales bacterium]|nr:FKBP-type peptidyl-prolyl cis-trans isomerase [Dehalococcoidales bacterium]